MSDIDNLIFKVKNFVFDTGTLMADFFQGTNGIAIGTCALIFYAIFMRSWTLKKSFSFLFTLLIFFAGLVHTDAFLIAKLGTEGAGIPTGITKIVFLAIAAVIYFYHATVKE